MIKSFKLFNEGKKDTLYFQESDEYEDVLNKYAPTPKDISEFFTDLEDERDIKTKFVRCSGINIKEDEFKLVVAITLEKTYKNPVRNKRNHIQTDDYLKRLIEETEDIKSVQNSCKHFAEVIIPNISLDFSVDEVTQIPHQPGEYGHLMMWVSFTKVIKTNEMWEAEIEFNNKDNTYREALKIVAKELVKAGVKEKHTDLLLDIHPGYEEMEDIDIGFSTDDKIITIGYITKSTGVIDYSEKNFAQAIVDYESGKCADVLGENYLQEE